MNKRITFELTQEEYDAVCKFWEQAKKAPVGPSQALNFDDFCKEIVLTCAKGPNLGDMLKDMNIEDLMGQMGDLSQLKDMFGSMQKQKDTKQEAKKDEVPDDKKYKS
ncbi:MAG: hypothetical protein KBS35_00885 [Mycoplasma sp.]|nr:hypothetical protein [Candidatus Hennigella equi]